MSVLCQKRTLADSLSEKVLSPKLEKGKGMGTTLMEEESVPD